ncbi:MAG: hypothetical protein ACRD96_10425, partial [Bryobacteraceae bacterium]
MKAQNTRAAVFVGAVAALLIAVGNLYWKVDSVREELAATRTSVLSEVSKVRVTEPPAPQATDKRIVAELAKVEALRQQLEEQVAAGQEQAAIAVARAKAEAVSQATRLVRQYGEDHQGQHKEVAAEIGDVRETA